MSLTPADFPIRQAPSDRVGWRKAKRVRIPNLKPSTEAISLGLPVDLLERTKMAVNKRMSLTSR